MKLFRYLFFSILFLQFFFFSAHAQQTTTLTDSIAQRVEWVGLQKQAATLFVHFDKTIYSNNENVWFTGYIIKTNTITVQHTLSVALIRNNDRSILAEGKYVMDNGLAMGNMVLPDSLPTGDYSLLCYTNLMLNGYPAAMFVQPITIKSGDSKSFNATLNLTDSIKPGMDSAGVQLKAMGKDYALVKKANVKYFIGDRLHPLHSGVLKTDNFGEARITIPLKKITAANNILQVEIDNGATTKNFSLKLPVYKKETIVKFYPEGGHLIEGTLNTVGWEVTNNEGEPVQVNATVYEDDKLLQTISTSVYGMGKFSFAPEKGSRYFVKLQNAADTFYSLPNSLQSGLSVIIPNALTNDTLSVNLNTQGVAEKIFLLVHDYRNTFINAPLTTSGKIMTAKVPLNDVPKGLTTITFLDSVGRPIAERLFFAHFDKRTTVAVHTDSTSYAMRQKVMLKFKVTDAANKSLPGLVSIACVQNNRLDLMKTMSIESYNYLTSELTAFPFKKNIMDNDAENKAFLEQLLLIKGWSRYTWRDVENIKPADSMPFISSLVFKGKVVHYEKKIKKPLQLNLKNFVTPKFSELEFIATDSTGNFKLEPKQITSEPNRKFELSVRNEYPEEYSITVTDPYKAMNRSLASTLVFPDYSPRSFAQSSQAFVLKAGEVAKTLKTVVITAQKDNSFFNARKPGINPCGDYVCLNGILNCINHPNDPYEPVVGKSYGVRMGGGSNIVQQVYYGCTALTLQAKNEFRFSMQGIYNKKEFYVVDLGKADITDPQYLSTIYWSHSVLTNANGEAELSFYTGDIPGKFRVVLQGVTTDNVLYGESYFEVRGE